MQPRIAMDPARLLQPLPSLHGLAAGHSTGGIVMRLRPFSRFTLLPSLLVVLGTTSAVAGAQASTHVGGRVGYNFDTREVMFSANLTVPMTSRVEFYPSIDIYAPDQGNRIGYNGDVKVSFPMTSGPRFYAGGGLGVVSRTVGDFSNTDVGANL